jgi:hypothetical protein
MATAKKSKTTVKKKVAAQSRTRKGGAKKAGAAKVETATPQENVRNVFLAGLGIYGKAFEEAQNQIKENRSRREQRLEKASELFEELVKRGEKVESDARKKLKELELPELKIPELKLTENEELRKELRTRLDKARDSFNTLRDAVSIHSGTG